MEEKNTTTKQQMISWYRNMGFDGETMALIMEDIEAGFDQEKIESYADATIPLDMKKRISKAIHNDLIRDIYSRIKGLTADRREEVMKAYDSGVPQEVIFDMIQRNYSAFHMKKALEEYKANLAEFAKEKMLSDKKNNKVKKQEEVKNEEESIPEQTEEKKPAPEKREQEKTDLSKDYPGKEIPASSGSESDLIEKCVETLSTTVKDAISNMADANSQMLKEMFNGVREHDEWLMKKMAEVRGSEQSVVKPIHVDAAPDPVIKEPTNEQSTIDRSKQFESEPIFKDEKKTESASGLKADAYVQTVMLPNGAVYPIFIERTEPVKPAGFMKRAAGLFKKEVPAKALINQLIDKKLNKEQLTQILRAVRLHFSKIELTDLIESDLPADEMESIIDVVLANKGQVAGVM